MWEMLLDESGNAWAISTGGQGFDQESVFTRAFLECPRYWFLRQGDGLIVITALEGIATYGVIEDPAEWHVPAVRARLLQVRPGLIEQIRTIAENMPDA